MLSLRHRFRYVFTPTYVLVPLILSFETIADLHIGAYNTTIHATTFLSVRGTYVSRVTHL